MSNMGRKADRPVSGTASDIAGIAFTAPQAPNSGMTPTPCCPRMADDLNRVCAIHADRLE